MKMRSLLASLAVLALSTSAWAAPTIVIPTKTVNNAAPATFFFDIGLSGTAGENALDYTALYNITPAAGAVGTLTPTTVVMAPNPLFATNPTGLTVGTASGATDFALSGTNTLTNDKFLFRQNFTLSAGATGTFNITLTPASAIATASATTTSLTNGSIVVTGVPEPTSLSLLGLGGLALLRRRAR